MREFGNDLRAADLPVDVDEVKSSAAEGRVGVFTRAAPTYDCVGPRHFSWFAKRLVEFVGVDPGSRVLDVATGTGAVLQAARERTGGEGFVVGVDISPAMLARSAAEIEGRSIGSVELYVMDGEHLDFSEDSFDRVLCSFGLQAFSDKQAGLVGFCRVLKPTGRLGIVYPLGWYFETDPRWRWQAEVLRSFAALDARRPGFAPGDLARAMRGVGFEQIETVVVTCPLDFRDEDEWWAWSWSHGTRGLYEAVPHDRQAALRQALFDGLRSCRGDDGLIHGSMSATIARAQKPLALTLR